MSVRILGLGNHWQESIEMASKVKMCFEAEAIRSSNTTRRAHFKISELHPYQYSCLS